MSWATERFARTERLSYLPLGPDDPEPAYAIGDAWELPDELALPVELCERIRETAARTEPSDSGNGTYFFEPGLTKPDEAAVIERFAEANRMWWNLEVDTWVIGVKRYGVGEGHVEHQDLHAGAAGRKLAGVVQLSTPDQYDGGALVLKFAHHEIEMPREQGTLVAFPGWTVHEVTRVARGQRWSLCINGWGRRLR